MTGMFASLAVTAACHVLGHGAFLAPDNSLACTPGAYQHLSLVAVCAHKEHTLPAAVRRDVLARYAVPAWTGADGEIDHRVPLYLGGLTTRENLWPERGSIPNIKDRLEVYTRRRVCGSATTFNPAHASMRARTARRMFLSDWRHAARYYGCADTAPGDRIHWCGR